jgi:hypothetical protein
MRVKPRGTVEKPKEPSSFVTDAAAMVAAATAMIYAVAFSFEVGFCQHFGIPLFLIIPTTSVILFALFGVVSVGFLLVQVMSIERAILGATSLPALFRSRLESSLLFALGGLASFGFSWSALGAAAFGFFMWCGIYIPALFFPKRGTFVERLREVEGARDYVGEASPFVGLAAAVGERGIQLFLFALLSCFIAASVGTATARTQKKFQIIAARPDLALVKSYGDLMIGIKFDESKKAATGEIVVFKMDHDFKQVNLTSRSIGPLSGVDRSFVNLQDLQ